MFNHILLLYYITIYYIIFCYIIFIILYYIILYYKGHHATDRVSGRLRPRIFLTFGTKRVVGRQPNGPAAFTPGEIPGTHFQRLSRPKAHGSVGGSHGKNPQ